MTDQGRKLATILAMDVVGYSAKMGKNEAATIAQLRNCQTIIERITTKNDGRIFNTAGDAFMIEFNTTTGALEAAIEIQEKLTLRNKKLPVEETLEFRMGINIGNVAIDGPNLLGDGVNIAARLEGIAPPSGICISDTVYSTVKGKVKCSFINKGLQKLKNIDEPVKAYYADLKLEGVLDPRKYKPKTGGNKLPILTIGILMTMIFAIILTQSWEPDRDSADFKRIAIVPFNTGSDDQALLNLATGLTQDLSGSLSTASKKLNVITLPEEPNNLSKLQNEIDARYLINGNIRKSGHNIRILVNLVEMTTMSTVWSKKYDKKFTASNIFSLQDQIINNIIDSLVGNGAVLAQEVAKNFSSSGTQNMSAYECVNFVRGQYFKVLSPEMHSQGLKCLRKAVKDDPEYKEAWGLLGHLLAWGYSLYVPFFQAVDKNGLSEAVTAVENAIRIDKNYARAYATRAELLFYERDWEQMMIYAEKAFELAPQDAYTMGQISYLTVLSGFGCKATQIVKEQFNVDQDACKRLDWGYQRARLAHELDAISSMTFENYGLGHYYYATNQWEKMLQIYEEVPTPKFHWWNFLMGFAHHKIGNKEQARYHLDIAREAIMSITDKPLEKLELRIEVWNMLSKFEDARSILKTYGWQ